MHNGTGAMSIIVTILIGFVVGLIARFLLPGKDALGIIMTTVVGVVGAILASIGGQALGLYAQGQPAGFLASVVGAVVLLLILRNIRNRQG
jgi:uncharacterized membrane protein YeaQ/YmgE (transglycosylase-associated protein family)